MSSGPSVGLRSAMPPEGVKKVERRFRWSVYTGGREEVRSDNTTAGGELHTVRKRRWRKRRRVGRSHDDDDDNVDGAAAADNGRWRGRSRVSGILQCFGESCGGGCCFSLSPSLSGSRPNAKRSRRGDMAGSTLHHSHASYSGLGPLPAGQSLAVRKFGWSTVVDAPARNSRFWQQRGRKTHAPKKKVSTNNPRKTTLDTPHDARNGKEHTQCSSRRDCRL